MPLAPIDVGQWSAVQNWPLVAVHSALQPTGQVLYWDAFNFAPDSERLWDPVLNTFIQVPYSRNLFCSGHIEVGDGRTVVFGGHIESNVGLHDTTIYNPQTQTWTRGPDMTSGRWYPTATTLGDGRVLVVSGDNMILGRTGVPEPFIDTSNTLPEVYNPTSNTWTDLPQAQRFIPLYPFMFVMPDGRVFDAGPDTVNRALNVDTGTWSVIANSPIDGGSAVMYRAGKILKTGTWGDSGVDYPGDGRAAVIDLNQPSPAWREVAPMAFARQFHNLIALPDGNVLAMGGATRGGGVDPTKAVLTPEIWNATSETWTSMAPMATPRMYHSTSLLLPDGRVVVAGGGRKGGATDFPSAEIYSPPYLFRGPRPTLSSAPGQVQYGSSFDVMTPDAANIASISLIHSGSMTHAFDENQRLLMLNFTRGSGKVTVTAPANGNLAPPGYYMLFIVDTNGVPSVGSFVRVTTTLNDTTPPTPPGNLAASPGPGQVSLSWNASTDNVGVARYNVYRSTTPGFTPGAGNRIAQPSGTSYSDTGLAAGTYY
ncbi:MAG: galactose oxidase-like domain-containing protein, partial [Gaiellaceae bacterium]